MPTYSFICPECKKKIDKFFNIKDNHIVICDCETQMQKNYKAMIPAYHDVAFDSVDYDLTGKPIPYSTKGQLRKIAKKHGCVVD